MANVNSYWNMLLVPYRYITYEYFRNDSNVEKHDKKHIVLTYHLNEVEYKILIKNNSGPSNILFVTDDFGDDITDEFNKIYGPGHDFHGAEIKPSYFDAEYIDISFLDGIEKRFYFDDIINL